MILRQSPRAFRHRRPIRFRTNLQFSSSRRVAYRHKLAALGFITLDFIKGLLVGLYYPDTPISVMAQRRPNSADTPDPPAQSNEAGYHSTTAIVISD
jgi:hypothetical protein